MIEDDPTCNVNASQEAYQGPAYILDRCSSDQVEGYSHTHWQWSLEKLIITNEVHTTAVTIVILIHTLNHPIRIMQGNNSVK